MPAQPNGSGSAAGNSVNNTPPSTTQTADTLRGIVTVVGSDPGTWLVLRPAGARGVSLTGAEALRSVSGAEVWVRGRAIDQHFEVDRFLVRAVSGRPVNDGVVTRSGAGVVVELTEGGRVEIPDAPPQLASLAGSRVWITTPVPGSAVSFGVIRAP